MATNPYGSNARGYRAPGALAVVALVATLAWAAVAGYGVSVGGGLSVDARVEAFGSLVYAAYALALASVLATTALFAGLYAHVREGVPTGAAVAFAFVPVYAVVGLAGYGGALAVPELIAAGSAESIRPLATLVPGLLPASGADRALATVVTAAHAVLALPALGFGVVLVAEWRAGLGGAGRLVGGVALALAAVAWLIGPGRVLLPRLGYATTAGTALYALALVGLAVDFLR